MSYDHPEEIAKVQNEEAERILVEKQFTGQQYFATKFNETQHIEHQKLVEYLKSTQGKYPVVIVVDLLGHFATMVYFQKKLVLVDTIDTDKMY